MNGYFAQNYKDIFAKIRAQFRPAAWNQAELSEEIDLSIDVDAEFQSAVREYFARWKDAWCLCAQSDGPQPDAWVIC